jgi:hypothetical protein
MLTATQASRMLQAGSMRTPPEGRFGTNNGAHGGRLRACWMMPSAMSRSKPLATEYRLKICKIICAWSTKTSSRTSSTRTFQRRLLHLVSMYHKASPHLLRQTTIPQLYRKCQPRYLQRQHSLCSCPLHLPPHHDQLSHQVCRFRCCSVLLHQSDSTTNRGRECCRAAISPPI